jgi:hypothetical protein
MRWIFCLVLVSGLFMGSFLFGDEPTAFESIIVILRPWCEGDDDLDMIIVGSSMVVIRDSSGCIIDTSISN